MRPFLAPTPATEDTSGPTPSMSVVIAAYRAAEFVGEAISSALAQTSPPLEVVVCDDGSDDGTVEAVEAFGEAVTLLRRDHGGEAAAKNTAIGAARGDFVVILDADDRWHRERLEALAELAAARSDLDILTTDAWMELDGRRLRRAYNEGWGFETGDQRLAILDRNFIFGHPAVRREVIVGAGGFDESIRRTTDWECWLRLIYAGSRAGLVDEPLASYRVHPGALSASRSGMFRGTVETLSRARSLDLSAAERRFLDGSIVHYRRLALWAELREALRDNPPAARRPGWSIARTRGFEASRRLKGVVAAVAPRLLARYVGRGGRDRAYGAGGVEFARE